MIDLSKYGISDNVENVELANLVVLSNIERANIDTSFISKTDNTFLIKGKQSNKVGSYAIFGCEIVKITEQAEVEGNTQVVVERGQFGTIQEEQVVGMKFRTVVPLISPIQLINWEFNDTMGSIGSTVFPVELGTGKIDIKDDPKKWMQFSLDKIYSIKNKKSMAFLFKGVDGKCILKNATVIEKVGFNTKGKRDPNMISINIKTVLAKWFDKDLAINQQIKSCEPKQFLQMIFGLEDHDVYYADGVTAESFVKIGNMHTKEYKKMSELLKAYASCGVRFCFDRYERIKIFSDMKVKNIQSQKTLKYNITDSMMNENSLLVFNKIDTDSYERQTMFDFDELNNQYVYFAGVKTNAISSDKFVSITNTGDYQADSVEIIDEQVFSAVQLKDYVLFKGTKAPYLEVYGRVGAKEKGNKVTIFPILQGDKDYKLFYLGKADYLYKNLSQNIQQMNLHYARFDLPMIWRYSRGQGNSDSEKFATQMLPLLPKVDGEVKYETEIVMTFGSASNLEVGEYSGIIEEVSGIYGTWDSSKLLYNQEKTQFSGKDYPPIFAMSNIGYENIVENQPMLFFNKFDNSNLLLEITKNEKSASSKDGKLVLSNTMNANSLIDIYEGEEVSRIGNRILQVSDMSPFKVGDILIVKNFDNPTSQESKLFDEKLSKLRYRITNKSTEVVSETEVKYWITLDNNFPPASQGKKWKFQRFPVNKIVYLQELYFRGNPVIQFSQEVSGFSSTTNTDGDTSKDIYGDKDYSFDSKLLEKDGVKMLMGYILDHFNGVTPMTTKYTLPISVYNCLGIELYDVVTVIDTVFTHVGESIKWLVTGIKSNAKTNVMELALINLNSTDTKPYDIDIKDVIEYDPVEIPSYDFAGGEGETDKPNGGEGGSDEDKKLGVVALAEVKREEFRARIERFDGNYVYFKDFSGTKFEEYTKALFPESEFAINVDGEIIFVQSDREFRAFIKKRRMYDTEEAVITPEMEIGFYVVSTMVGIDGTFYSRRTHIGDGATYFKFDPINGAHFVGDFVVGTNGQHAGNDLWLALQNTKTYYSDVEPTLATHPNLKNGDLWINTLDRNHPWVWNNGQWVDAQDKVYEIKGGNKVYYTGTRPVVGETNKDGVTMTTPHICKEYGVEEDFFPKLIELLETRKAS